MTRDIKEQAMMPYQSYQFWETERSKTAAEQRAADARVGEIAAALSGPFSQVGRKLRAVADRRGRIEHSVPPVAAPSSTCAGMGLTGQRAEVATACR
jgi:hypothetical protein